MQVSFEGAVLHHYISRSVADFEVKAQRRGGAGSVKTLAHFLKWHRHATERCPRAVAAGHALARRFDLNQGVPERCRAPQAAALAAAVAAENAEEPQQLDFGDDSEQR